VKKEPWIWVRNNSAEQFSDRFDGEPYIFPPGVAVEIPAAGAKLIFGFGEDSKDRVLQRLGWARQNTDRPEALKRLNKFSFHTEDPNPKPRPPHAPVGADNATDTPLRVPGAPAASSTRAAY
jgi:hypothetical protein